MDVSYCGACGAPLASKSAKMCVKCGSNPRIAVAYCPGCGEKLKSKGAVICPECGFPLRGASGDKDPGIAALISVVCMLFLGAPAAGYFYLGKVKKGLIYLLASWVVLIATVVLYLVATGGTMFAGMLVGLGCGPLLGALLSFAGMAGTLVCLVVFVIPLLFELAIVYDVYVEAKGDKPLLPFSGD
jgi:hypothetical protein